MRKYLCLIFLLFFVLGFSQATNPVASDVSSAHFKDTDGLIHLVGSDAEYGVLTYTIVSLPSHGTLKDPLNGNAVVSAGGSLTGSLVTFTPHSDENHKYIFSGTNSFTYKVTDSGSLDSDVKTVTVKVYDEYLNPPTLIGTEIDGEAAGDNFGRSVSLSEDGMIMAVGAPYNNGNGEKAGSVRVYEFNGSDWDRYGTVDTQLEGASVGDYFGSSVSLSGDGTILAVGLPYRDGSSSSDSGEVRIFKYMSGSWVNIGTKIPSYSSSSPKNVSKYFGNDVRLSSDGKTLAVSDIWYSNIASDDAFTGIGGTNSGRVVVYRYDGSSWNSLGNEFTLYADAQNNNGWGLSLSADGNILAVGAHEDDTTAGNAGKVQVYQYDFDNNEWDTKGSALLGDSSNDKFGAAIDLNSSGLIIAVGSSYDRPDSLLGQGTVNVYGWNGTNYVTLGSEIKGLNKFDYFGAQLSLDNEGNSLVIMAPGHDDTSGSIRKYQGQVRIYNYDISSTSWVQSPGTDVNIEGEAINNQSADNNAESKGQRVFLSGDGSVLAIGADENDGNGTDSGHVRVYKLFEPQIIPVAVSQTVDFVLYEQVDSEDITLDGSDGDSGPSDLVYIITELNTARLIENGTPIGAIPHTLTGKVVKYNSNSDVVVNDTFKFIVHDGKASSIPATVTLTVTPDNDAPIAIDQDLTTDEDVAIDTITLSATDVDSPQGDMIYIIETLPTKGTLKEGETTITAAGTVLTAKDIIYTPNLNYSGADSFTFKVKDKGVGSDGVTDVETSTIAATISITVNNTDNDPPIAENKALSTEEETVTGTITLVAADPDDEDSTLVYTIASLPTDGTLKADGTAITAVGDLSGALTYTPNTDFVGDDTFTFTAKDDEGAVSNTATVTISVSNTNDPPVSQDKALSTEEETVTGTITLVATDVDDDDTTLVYTIASLPTDGTLKADGTAITAVGDLSGALTYTPNTDFVGDDTFTFTAKDDEGAVSNTATVTISVSNTNDPPVSQDKALSTEEETVTGTITLVATDVDDDDTTLVYTIASLPTDGTLKADGTAITAVGDLSGALTYTPNTDFVGDDTFTFTAKDDEGAVSNTATVTISVSNTNDPPVSQDKALSTEEETVTGTITLVATDVDDDDTTLVYTIASLPTDGTLKADGTAITAVGDLSGALTYTPNTDYNGDDTFTFTAKDDEGAVSNISTVTITVTPFNDPPTADDQSIEATEQTPITITLTGSDAETTTLTYIVSTLPSEGTLKDGSTAIASGDLPKTLSGNTVVFTGTSDTPTPDSFKFKTQDEGTKQSSDATVSITFSALNDPPVSQDKALSTEEETVTGTITLVATDVDDDDTTLVYTIASLPTDGTLKADGTAITAVGDLSGALTYTPNTDYNGDDTFTFTAKDDEGAVSNISTVTITVTPFNDPPTADDQSIEATEQTPITITLTGSDAETTTLTYIVSTLPSEGTLKDGSTAIASGDLPKTLSGNTVVFTGTSDTPTPDSFKFKTQDEGTKQSSDATVSITFSALNDPPVASAQSVNTKENVAKEITHEGTDADGDALTYIIITLPTNGTLTDSGAEIASGDLPKTLSSAIATYTPETDYNGADSYTFKVNDGTVSSTAVATVDITIDLFNDPPTADDQNLKTDEDTALDITLTGSDPEGDPLTYLVKTLPTNGKLKDGGNIILASELPKLLPANALTYVPDAGFVGDDSFTFIINANFLNSFTKANGLKYIAQDGVPVTYQKPEGKTYFLIQEGTGVSGNPIDWTTARDLTNTIEGAKMYVVLNAEMELLVWNGLKSMGLTGKGGLYFWLGLYQDKTSPDYAEPGLESQNWGGWTWVDGVTLKDRGYHNWYNYPSEPNQAGAEDYAQFEFSSNGIQWNDMSIGNAQSWPLFEFSINENTNSNDATININVASVNDPIVADDQNLKTNEDTPLDINLTALDPEGIDLAYVIKSLPTNGTLLNDTSEITAGDLPKVLPANTLKYQPNQDYNGNDSFTFYAKDKSCTIVPCEESNVATVAIEIDPLNDPPESDPQTVNTDEDVPVDITHMGRDKDLVDIFSVHTQMGKDLQLPGNWGEFIEISADGKTMVIGGWLNNKVKVYGWNGTAWNQLGSDIDGSASGDNFGEFVSISSDGKRVAVGAPKHGSDRGEVRAFDWDGTSWTQAGLEMEGNATEDAFSFRGVHISGDGDVIAAASFKQGYVYTYKWNGTNWDKTGVVPIDKSSGGAPGQVSLSSDGARLAIGNAASSSNQGQVKIFDWDGTNTWNQYVSIDGNSGDKFGNTLSISRDGNKLVIGVQGAGSARVYDLSGSNASQVGADINYGNNAAWRAISMSDDGNRIAIPIYGAGGTGAKTGVFDWDGTLWNQLGLDIVSPNLEGESLDMSSDGKTLAIGGHNGMTKVFNILNLQYIITTYPSNGILKEGSKTLVASDLPYILTTSDQKLTYVPNAGYYGEDKYNFKLNDGKADSTDKVSGLREDSQVTIIIKEFVLELPNNYKITPTETCKGSDFGILDIEVAATSYKKTANGPDIPITYKISIEGKGELATIVSPNKTAQIKDLPAGKHKLIFKVVQEPKYEEIIVVEITASDPPVAYAVAKLEVCDDAVDQDDSNGKVNFDTSTILNTLLKNPSTGVVQDEKLFDIEFTYFDQATSANVTKATLPNPLYSASQTVSVKIISKINGKCIGSQTIDFQVNTLPVFDRIETNISVCTNLEPVTIGVASKDSRSYTYVWTRNGTAFAPNIAGIDSSILIGLGGEYIVTATTKDGTSCSKSMTIKIKESSIAKVEKKDIVIKDLNAGPNNTITIKTETLGIGDYEYAIDDKTGPYQDEPVFENIRPGLHTIYIRDKNECGIAQIDVSIIGYKKFFTPNGDGIHDTWNIIGLSKINQPKTKIYIFDRYGKLLKELDPLSPGWDGTFIGKPMPSTDYWFRVQLEDGREFKSHFSLVRPW